MLHTLARDAASLFDDLPLAAALQGFAYSPAPLVAAAAAALAAELLLLGEIEMEEAERILAALEGLATLTWDRMTARLQRLHDREHL